MADGTTERDLPPAPLDLTDRAANGRQRFDRLPPHSPEAEVSALGAALLSRTAASDVVELLRPDDFYRTAHRIMFEAVRDLMSRGEPVDAVTALDWLVKRDKIDEVGGAGAVHELTAVVPTAANAAYYARIVREKALLRRLIDAGTEVARMGYDATDDARTVVDRAEALVYEVAQTGTVTEFARLNDLLNESFERIEQLADVGSEVTGLATGFDDLDRLTAGLQPQNLVIIAARPSVGKSSLALNVAEFVTVQLRRPALLFSLEMSKHEIVSRLLASQARIESQKLRTGRLDEGDWRRLSDALGHLSEAPLFIDDTPAITLMEIRSKCRRLKQRHGLDLVVVDYLQLMQSHKRVDNRQQEVSEISRGLKMLAKELDVPVIALSQLSRQPETRTDKRPMLADLRESGCLVPETRVVRRDTGTYVSLGELHASGERDVPIWSVDERGRLVPAHLSHVFSSGVKPVFELTLASGLTVTASGNHPFLAFAGWRRLDQLAPGDRLAVPRRALEPSSPINRSGAEIILLAHLIGDGCALSRRPVHYTSMDLDNLAAVEVAAKDLFEIEARRVAQGNVWHSYLPSPYPCTHGRRNPINEWLASFGLFDKRSWQKFVPQWVYALPDDQVALFLHHLWSTDGSICRKRFAGRSDGVAIYYATTSKRLALDVNHLLLRLGVMARIKRYRQASRGRRVRDGYQVHVTGRFAQRQFLTRIGSHGARGQRVGEMLRLLDALGPENTNVDTIPHHVWDVVRGAARQAGLTDRQLQAGIGNAYCGTTLYRQGMSRARLMRVAEAVDDDRLRDLATSDLLWDRVTGIRSVGETEVFDATVPGLHNFVADGIVVHNSLEQDSDIVAFIYRDEVYDQDTPDKGVAELIVAKHRNGATGIVKLAFLSHWTKFANLARSGTAGGMTPM